MLGGNLDYLCINAVEGELTLNFVIDLLKRFECHLVCHLTKS